MATPPRQEATATAAGLSAISTDVTSCCSSSSTALATVARGDGGVVMGVTLLAAREEPGVLLDERAQQEPWVGLRGKVGVVIPSTNTAVEYDLSNLRLPGVTWHIGRFLTPTTDLSSDNAFLTFLEGIRTTIPQAVTSLMTGTSDRRSARPAGSPPDA